MECVASVAKLRERHLELVPLGIAERTLGGIHRREGPRLVDTLALLVHHEARAALDERLQACGQQVNAKEQAEDDAEAKVKAAEKAATQAKDAVLEAEKSGDKDAVEEAKAAAKAAGDALDAAVGACWTTPALRLQISSEDSSLAPRKNSTVHENLDFLVS